MSQRPRVLLALVIAISLLAAACSDDEDGPAEDATATTEASSTETPTADRGAATDEEEPKCEAVGDASAAESRVEVVLSEFIVTPTPTEVAAGTITLALDNQGGDAHELVVVKGEDPAGLPTGDDGGVDEDGLADGAFIGEVEPFPAGETCEGTFALDAGTYVLFCNIVEEEDDGTIESHFAEGMATTFSVT